MKKSSTSLKKPLRLTSETIRNLQTSELSAVEGGLLAPSSSGRQKCECPDVQAPVW